MLLQPSTSHGVAFIALHLAARRRADAGEPFSIAPAKPAAAAAAAGGSGAGARAEGDDGDDDEDDDDDDDDESGEVRLSRLLGLSLTRSWMRPQRLCHLPSLVCKPVCLLQHIFSSCCLLGMNQSFNIRRCGTKIHITFRSLTRLF